MKNKASFLKKIKIFIQDMQTVNRDKMTELIEYELTEMRNIFALLLFGSFTGMPAPPVHITLELLPEMEEELELMYDRVSIANDALSELFAAMGDH